MFLLFLTNEWMNLLIHSFKVGFERSTMQTSSRKLFYLTTTGSLLFTEAGNSELIVPYQKHCGGPNDRFSFLIWQRGAVAEHWQLYPCSSRRYEMWFKSLFFSPFMPKRRRIGPLTWPRWPLSAPLSHGAVSFTSLSRWRSPSVLSLTVMFDLLSPSCHYSVSRSPPGSARG